LFVLPSGKAPSACILCAEKQTDSNSLKFFLFKQPQLTAEPRASTEGSSISSPFFSSLWGSLRPAARSLPSAVGLSTGELVGTSGAGGASQALWPAGTVAVPSARSSASCHCSHLGSANADFQFAASTAMPQTNLDMSSGPAHVLIELPSFS